MKRSTWLLFVASLAIPLISRADGDVIVKDGGSIRIQPGASLIVGPNQIVDIQSGGTGFVAESGEVDGNVTVRAGGTLILCGTITGNLLNLGTLRNCLPKPDALIGPKEVRLKGNDTYSPTGAGQGLSINLKGRKSAKFVLGGQNDGAVPAGLRFRSHSVGESRKIAVNQITGTRVNVSAQVSRGGYLLSDIAPGQTVLFQISVRVSAPSARTKTLRIFSDVIAESDGSVRDRAGATISQPASVPRPGSGPVPHNPPRSIF